MQKVLQALGTILVVVIALVAADQISGAIQRMRDRKLAAKNAAADAASAANGSGDMRVAA